MFSNAGAARAGSARRRSRSVFFEDRRLGGDDLLAAVVAVGRHVVAAVRLAGRRVHRQRRLGQLLVRAAVAYALANDEIGLSRLRLKYSDQMALSPEWPLFDFVTSRADPTSLRFREIVAELAGIDTLDNFLAAYSRSYGNEGSALPTMARPVGI